MKCGNGTGSMKKFIMYTVLFCVSIQYTKILHMRLNTRVSDSAKMYQ